MHDTNVELACKGFCPCKARAANRKSGSWSTYKSKKARGDDKKMSKFVRDQDNAVRSKNAKRCSKDELKLMGNRLLDWFKVLMSDKKRRSEVLKKQKRLQLPDCRLPRIGWMFYHLDTDGDLKLSLKELYDLEHNQHEPCLKQYLNSCDEDRDTFINPYEWCACFDTESKCSDYMTKSRLLHNATVCLPFARQASHVFQRASRAKCYWARMCRSATRTASTSRLSVTPAPPLAGASTRTASNSPTPGDAAKSPIVVSRLVE